MLIFVSKLPHPLSSQDYCDLFEIMDISILYIKVRHTLRSFVEKWIPKPVLVRYIDCLVMTHKLLNALEGLSPHKIEFALTIGLKLDVFSTFSILVEFSSNPQSALVSPYQKCPFNRVLRERKICRFSYNDNIQICRICL